MSTFWRGVIYYYHGFWPYARVGGLFCFCWRYAADGVRRVSVSVSDAGEVRSIALISVENLGGTEFTGKHNAVTGRLRRARRPTAGQKTGVGMGGAKRNKKRWMIPLQEDGRGML